MAKIESLESRRLLTTLPTGFAQSMVLQGLDSPTSMTVAPDGRIFVTEQAGTLRVVKNGQLLSTPFMTVKTVVESERGLSCVELDPNFASNGFVYVYYTAYGTTANRVSRFTANGDVAVAGSEKVLFQLDATGHESSFHQGGSLHFGPDGKLYVTTGDHGGTIRSQQLTNQVGKVLRLNPDGSIPTDNPFYNQTTGNNRAIWARGLRNPLTAAFQPGTGRYFINDVGENSWEEINLGRAGANYGWPDSEGATTNPQFDGPVYTYPHTEGHAIVGGVFYNPKAGAATPFPSQYVGQYFFTDYAKEFMRTIDPATKKVSGFGTNLIGRPIDLDLAADGSMYYLSRAVGTTVPAAIYRIRYTGSAAPAIGVQPASQTVPVGRSVTFSVSATGSGTLKYQWQRNGTDIAGATNSSYTLTSPALSDNGAKYRVIVSNASGSATSNAATLTVTSNHAPVPTITLPASGTTYIGGSVITFAGTATDAEDGTLPASAFTWRVDLHHDDHTHPFVANTTGVKGGTFTIPTIGELSPNVWYRVHLTVKDSQGLTTEVTRDVRPVEKTITVNSNVPGLKLTLDGQPVTAPVSVLGVVGMDRSVGAPATQVLDGVTYQFVSWSDGGAATHGFSFPASNKTYTATYRPVSGTSKTLSATADSYVRNGDGSGNNYGSTEELLVRSSPPGGLTRLAYYKFDLSSLDTIGTAKLRLFGRLISDVASDSVVTGVFGADSGWTEAGLNFNNKPVPGSAALATTRVAAGALQWYEWDVTDYLRQQKAAGKTSVTLVVQNLTLGSTSAGFRSREASGNRPQLVVTG